MECYYHGIRNYKEEAIPILNGIMRDGIKSVASGNLKSNEESKMNYDNEICLCKGISNLSFGNTIFDSLIYSGRIVLRINGDIPGVYKPKVISSVTAYDLVEQGKRGFTEYEDEYRTQIDIPTSSINSILFPAKLLVISRAIYQYNMFGFSDKYFDHTTKKDRIVGTLNYFESVQDVVARNDRDIPIFDSVSGRRLESPNDILVKVLKYKDKEV